jgi:preprotein translocase subunit SecB
MTAHTFLIEVEQMDHCSSAMCCVCMLFPFVHSMCVSGQLQRSLSVYRSQGS